LLSKDSYTIPVAVCIGVTHLAGRTKLVAFKNRLVAQMFRCKKTEVEGNWKKLHNDELHNLYCSSNIIKMTKSGRMVWMGPVVHMGEMRNDYKILVGNCKECLSLYLMCVSLSSALRSTATLSSIYIPISLLYSCGGFTVSGITIFLFAAVKES
jgi:hypothetical protein